MIFTHSFADGVDILFPRQRTLFQPITFGLFFTNVTPKITRACAHSKLVTQPEQFSCLEILWAYDQYAIDLLRVIHPSRALAFQQIKIYLKSCKRTQSSGVFRVPGLYDVRNLPFEILDKWKYSDPVRDH